MDKVVRVLIVDDSAYVRKVVKQMLSRSPFVEVVGAASDGKEALELVEQLQPDVVTLNLIMPRMDGVTFLREQMARRPLPVVVVSITSENGELMLQALEAGAIDMVQKPTALATEKVFEMGDELIAKVKAAAGARLTSLTPKSSPNVLSPSMPQCRTGAVDVVVIGVSTGGPQALKFLIPQLPANLGVPVAMVLHMPLGHTELYARSLNEISRLEVAEAHEGDLLRPGIALLAPAGRHLSFQRKADGYEAAVNLAKVLTGVQGPIERFGASSKEVLSEVGNILLNSCLGMFGDLLHVRFSFTVPRLHLEALSVLLSSLVIGKDELHYALLIGAQFHLQLKEVSGCLVIVLGIASLGQLMQSVENWAEASVSPPTKSAEGA
jgi:two-component system, chemotaxis family, protein-glutamate methylesterase/glutaminase